MKKIEVCFIIITLALIALLFTGCEEQFAKPDIRRELVKAPGNWVSIYGDDLESQQTANIALIIQVVNKQAETIKQLDIRLDDLEEKITDSNNLVAYGDDVYIESKFVDFETNSDPNYIRWSESIYYQISKRDLNR